MGGEHSRPSSDAVGGPTLEWIGWGYARECAEQFVRAAERRGAKELVIREDGFDVLVETSDRDSVLNELGTETRVGKGWVFEALREVAG